jgi:hypothetical protein
MPMQRFFAVATGVNLIQSVGNLLVVGTACNGMVFVLLRPGEPGVYMRVSYYMNFINSIMNRGDQIR